MKSDNDLNVRIVVECELHFGIKNIKYVEVCDGIYKERRVDQMRTRAYNHLQSLCDEFKDHFDNDMFETLAFTQTLNKVTEKDVEDLLAWHIRRLDDVLDVLMI